MLKWAGIVTLASALLVAAFYGGVVIASESDEVITLRTQDETSAWHGTRLWVVDHAGAEWTRTGHDRKQWFQRLLRNPSVELERRGERSSRVAVPVRDEDVARAVNEVFGEKYGAADWIVALSGDAAERVVIRLDRTDP